MENREEIETQLIEAWKFAFDKYSNLKYLPVYMWGRYRYELRGQPFELSVHSKNKFPRHGIENKLDVVLLDQIFSENEDDIDRCKIGEYYPERRDCVYQFKFDEEDGMCLVLVRDENEIKMEVWECDQPL